nr:hypothetical protein [Mycoplasmopsis bovis]
MDELNLKLKNISERELEIKADSISIHSSEAWFRSAIISQKRFRSWLQSLNMKELIH